MSVKKQHYAYMDGVRAAAIAAVVLIHALANIVNQSQSLSLSWQTANLLNLSLRWAVPVFIMISGALLLPKKSEQNSAFVVKRLQRLLIPFVVFVAIYFWWYNHLTFSISLMGYLEKVLVWGNPYYHLYFLYAIFGLYLITPALRVMVRGMSDRSLGILILVIILMSAYWSYTTSWYKQVFPRDTLMAVTHFIPYVGYYLLGYYLHVRYRLVKLGWWAVAGFGLLWFSLIATTHWFAAGGYSAKTMMLEDYASINVVVMAVLIFMGIKIWYNNKKIIDNPKWIKSLAAAALGIYLIHVMILETTARYLYESGYGGWTIVVGAFGVALLFSWALTVLIANVPKLKRVVGR